MEGEGLVQFITWKMSVSTEHEALSCSFCPKCWSFKRSRSKKKVLLLVQMKNACAKSVPSIGDPSHFYPVIAVDKTSPGLKEREEQKICHIRGRSCLVLQPPKSETKLRSSADSLSDQFGLQFVAFFSDFSDSSSHTLLTSHSTTSLSSCILHTQAWITSSTNDTHKSENL